MSCDPKSFPNVTEEVFNCLRDRLSDAGYAIQGTSGSISGPMGIVIAFRWDAKDNTLHTQVKSKSFLVPCSRINSELEKAVGACSKSKVV